MKKKFQEIQMDTNLFRVLAREQCIYKFILQAIASKFYFLLWASLLGLVYQYMSLLMREKVSAFIRIVMYMSLYPTDHFYKNN